MLASACQHVPQAFSKVVNLSIAYALAQGTLETHRDPSPSRLFSQGLFQTFAGSPARLGLNICESSIN